MKFITASLVALATATQTQVETAADADTKLYINLYYEALCPYCRNEITTNIRTAMLTPGFSDMADLEIFPFGNAKEKVNGSSWTYTCQHGPHECVWDLWEGCINNFRTFYSEPKYSYEWIECIEA